MACREASLGPAHPATQEAMLALALCLDDMQCYDNAVPLLTKVRAGPGFRGAGRAPGCRFAMMRCHC